MRRTVLSILFGIVTGIAMSFIFGYFTPGMPLLRDSAHRAGNASVEREQRDALHDGGEPPPGQMDEHAKRHRDLIEWHSREPVDVTWAATAQRLLVTELGSLRDMAGFEINDVNCRSTSCVAITKWSDYRAALSGYDTIMHYPSEMQCAREMFLEAPSEPDEPYTTTTVFTRCRAEAEAAAAP